MKWAACSLLLSTTLGAFPQHSWETLPVAFHSSAEVTNARGEFSAGELDTISRFKLVTIEKWQGSLAVADDGSPVFLWEETAMLNAAAQVKKRSPETSVIVWLDSSNVYTGWVFPPNLTSCPHCTVDAKAHNILVNHTFNADVFAVQGHSRLRSSRADEVLGLDRCHIELDTVMVLLDLTAAHLFS